MALNAAAAEPKRVLIVHSFGNAAPPFTTASTAFETALTEEMGKPVDLDEVSLDVARYATLEMEEALVELMRKRQTRWQPDLVVPMGSPACIFVAQHRDRLFPTTTPIIYTGMDRRRLPAGTLQHNAAFVGASYDLPHVVEDILQVAPDTTNVVIVLGATPLEHFWADVLRQEYEVFTNRLSFTWFNDLPFEQMLERSAKLPPHSFMLLILLIRDAAGVTHNANDALRRLHQVANAPITGLFHEQLGQGIVGGRIHSDVLEGRESARIAVRILRGEPPTNFSPKIIEPLGPQYDWRELRRWNISEDRLPSGSTILFRQPTVWDRYKGRIVGVTALVLLQGAIIFFLLANLAKRRRAERSLAETEARFRVAANSAPVMIWLVGTNKLCTFLNKAWLEFTGRTMDEDLGDGWTNGVHPQDRAKCLRTYETFFDARREFTMEYRLRKRGGEYAWVIDHGVPRFASDGAFLGYVGSVTDITPLRQAQERWRLVVEGAPNAMVVANGEGMITLVNARTEAIFGYTRTELLGSPAEMLVPEALRAHFTEVRQRYMAKPTPSSLGEGHEILGRRKDGSQMSLEIGLSPLRTPEGQFVLASIIDITERLAAERKLRESEERMSLAADAAHLGMWVWNLPDTYMWASEQWRTMHGYTRDENLPYDALLKRAHFADRLALEHVITKAINERGAFHLEMRVVLPDGTVRWVSKSGRVEQMPNDGPLRVLGISIDITERKQAEEATREVSGKLITAQEDERKRIARDLHDDLNQRLALLSVETDLLGRMENSAPAQTLVNDIASRVRDLSSEVHKLSYQLHPAKLDQLGLVSATRSFCHELSKQCGVAVEFTHQNIPRGLDRDVALCLYRVVQESLQNMVRHSRATRASVHLKREAEALRLVVSDNGRGFDVEMASHHAGLGLLGMRERVRLVHGQITFQSAASQGTRVEVTIPAVAGATLALS